MQRLIGAGFASYALGWWGLPEKVEKVEERVEDTETNIKELVTIQKANFEAQQQLNVQQAAFYKEQIQFMRENENN